MDGGGAGRCDIIAGVRIRVAPAIEEALALGEPVVALESTVITHGLPRPRNLQVARDLEEAVAKGGALPATVAVLDGIAVVGAGADELERLASEAEAKASLWNLASLISTGTSAGTTVAATLHIAAAAGIKVFATGGIGGVHADHSDVSADLTALTRYPVLTVCSGPKSILDARATLERLESLGVPVVGHRSRRLAGFHVRETDLPLPSSAGGPKELARHFQAHLDSGIGGGLLVSNPVSAGLEPAQLAEYRRAAEREATEQGVGGKDVTPFLLARLAQLSDGGTVEVNQRLLVENSALAGAIAAALSGRTERRTPVGANDD